MSTVEAITVPKWGMTMTEGTITQWLVNEGAQVSRGQELLEIETTKVSNVVESTASGVLRKVVLAEGTTAPVGALAGVIADDTVSQEEIEAFIASYADRLVPSQAGQSEDVSSKTVSVDGGVINLVEAGPVSEDSVVLLHGFGGNLSTWMFNQSTLAETRRVIALDLPGHGGSSVIGDGNVLAEVVSKVEAVIEAVAPGQLHLVGHSFGGAIAAMVAANQPSRVSSLSLIAPVGLGKTINRDFLVDFVAAERRRPLQGVLERLFADPSKITSDMIEETLKFKRLEGVPETLSRLADTIVDENGQRLSITDKVAALKCPVLLIWGDLDQIVPFPQADDVPANAKVYTIHGAGHMPQMEAANSVNDAIIENIGRAN